MDRASIREVDIHPAQHKRRWFGTVFSCRDPSKGLDCRWTAPVHLSILSPAGSCVQTGPVGGFGLLARYPSLPYSLILQVDLAGSLGHEEPE